MSLGFYEAQRVGRLPADNPIPWRHNALLYEASPNFAFNDLTGGYLNGGVAGALALACGCRWCSVTEYGCSGGRWCTTLCSVPYVCCYWQTLVPKP